MKAGDKVIKEGVLNTYKGIIVRHFDEYNVLIVSSSPYFLEYKNPTDLKTIELNHKLFKGDLSLWK